jgi:tetratricopeptide (TPR) repeat protein
MLFDLRSRGRRRTVQGVYLGLAIILGGGLVLFGVGAGNGFGGLLNAFNTNSSTSSQPAVSQAEKSALRQTQLQPTNPAGWVALVEARYEAAGQNANQTTAAYTSTGLVKLRQATQAWQRYAQLTNQPNWTIAELIAHAYENLGDFKNATSAWQIVTKANPNAYTYYEYMAADAWSAKETDLGDLASQKAVSLAPATQRAQVKGTLQQLKARASAPTSSPTPAG